MSSRISARGEGAFFASIVRYIVDKKIVTMECSSIDHEMMRRALSLAEQALGQTSPNPAVGAVITCNGEIVGEGFHRRKGEPHAERMAVMEAEAAGFTEWGAATLYCTLEPCSTVGLTGACSSLIVQKGFKRVVYGSTDPNPAHTGGADRIFQEAGIELQTGLLEEECDHLIRGFRKVQKTGMPWVIIKSAMSLDGKITRPPGEGQWLTSEAARVHVHELRAEVDAIITGGNTVRHDDPALTVRIEGRAETLRQPRPVIITRDRTSLPETAQLLQNAETLVLEKPVLKEALLLLGRSGVDTVLIEAGGDLLGAFVDEGLVDEVVFFYAPILTGGAATGVGGIGAPALPAAMKLENVHYSQIKDDIMMRALVDKSAE